MLEPDPFTTWGMTSLGASSTGHRLLLDSLGGTTGSVRLEEALPAHMHSLLQAGDSSSLPVLGRVSVREARATVSLGSGGAPQPGSSAAIDDEISAYTPVPPDPSNPAGYAYLEATPSPPQQAPPEQPQLPQSVQDAFASIARAFTDQGNQRIMIIVAAVVAPLGLLLCLAGILYARQRRHRKEQEAKASGRGSDDGFREAQEVGVQDMQPHETGYGSVCGVHQPAMLPPSCDSSADGASGAAAGVARSMFNTLRSSVSGMASGVASAIDMHRGSSGDAYKLEAPRQPQNPGAGLLRGPSLDMQWPPTLRRREPTLPGSRRSLDAPAERRGVSTALPVSRPAARLGQPAVARQPYAQQQQPQVVAAQWRPAQQQGPRDVMWGTPDMQAARSGSVYNNPLAQPESGSGSAGGAAALAGAGVVDDFFLSGGDTFLIPTELAFAGSASLSQPGTA